MFTFGRKHQNLYITFLKYADSNKIGPISVALTDPDLICVWKILVYNLRNKNLIFGVMRFLVQNMNNFLQYVVFSDQIQHEAGFPGI